MGFPDPHPLKLFTDPDPTFSSEYHLKRLKIISLMGVFFPFGHQQHLFTFTIIFFIINVMFYKIVLVTNR